MEKRRTYARIARFYDFLDYPFEHSRYRPLRGPLFAGAAGRILDAGVGTGRNMPFYPAGGEVIGIDLSAAMLVRAAKRRAQLGAKVALIEMDVLQTAFPDATFDLVVSTFLFCVLDDDQQLPALAELARICRPDGEIRILEYAYSTDPLRRLVMRLWAPWVRFAYGAAFDRDTERYVSAAGLELVETRFLYRDVLKLMVARPRRASR